MAKMSQKKRDALDNAAAALVVNALDYLVREGKVTLTFATPEDRDYLTRYLREAGNDGVADILEGLDKPSAS